MKAATQAQAPERGDATLDPGLGHHRNSLFCAASDRIVRAQEEGFWLEAIVLVESMLADRMESRIRHLWTKDREGVLERASKWNALHDGDSNHMLPTREDKLVKAMDSISMGFKELGPLAKNLRAVEGDPGLGGIAGRIFDEWRASRNNAVHAMVKAEAASSKTWEQRLGGLPGVVDVGVNLLVEYDSRDRHIRHENLPAKAWPSATCPDGLVALGAGYCAGCRAFDAR